MHDLNLPTLLTHARGVVVINSTVGLSALHHQTPTITLGKAIYDMPGLTFQGDLRHFWTEAQQQIPDLELYWKFRNHVVDQTQLNGSFYRTMAGGDASGLIGRVAVRAPRRSRRSRCRRARAAAEAGCRGRVTRAAAAPDRCPQPPPHVGQPGRGARAAVMSCAVAGDPVACGR